MAYPMTKRTPCSVCGLDTLRRDQWFLVVENRWLDHLKILTWHPSLASQQGVKSVCGRQHLKVLIRHWLEQDSLRLSSPNAEQTNPITSTANLGDVEIGPSVAGYLVGELSVYREAFSSVWTGSPATLESIVDALLPVEGPEERFGTRLQFLQSPHEPPSCELSFR